jgi:hypothetical protein
MNSFSRKETDIAPGREGASRREREAEIKGEDSRSRMHSIEESLPRSMHEFSRMRNRQAKKRSRQKAAGEIAVKSNAVSLEQKTCYETLIQSEAKPTLPQEEYIKNKRK